MFALRLNTPASEEASQTEPRRGQSGNAAGPLCPLRGSA